MSYTGAHFEQLRRTAQDRGMADHERGYSRHDNPYRGNCATDEAEYWAIGWDNAAELARQDEPEGKK